MLDLSAQFVGLVTFQDIFILDCFLIEDLNVNRRTLILHLLLLSEEIDEGRTDCDDVIGCIHHQVEFLLPDVALADPRGSDFVEIFLHLAMLDYLEVETLLNLGYVA